MFAYVPDERSLRHAMDQARGYSLVAVEGSRFSLAEWAAGADAINLLTNETSSSAIPDDVRDDLGSVVLAATAGPVPMKRPTLAGTCLSMHAAED